MKYYWFLFLPLLMSCAQFSTEPVAPDVTPRSLWQERRYEIMSFSDWSLKGRAAIRLGTRTENASFFWNGSLEEKEFKLLGPFGNGRLRLYEDAYGAVLQDETGQKLIGKSVEELLSTVSTWPIPFTQMNYWVRGLPAPGKHAGVALDHAGRARWFFQDGWKVEYTEYRMVDGINLPKRIIISSLIDQTSVDQDSLQREQSAEFVSVKLSIGSWSYRQKPG